LSEKESRAVLFLRANELARGFSGVRADLVRLIEKIFNAGVCPLIPSRGSVGASGDLAPLAHTALLLIGEGEALVKGKRVSARAALKKAGVRPIELEEKEGLSLLNGTQVMQAVGGLALTEALRVLEAAQIAGAMSLEATMGTPGPYDEAIHKLKPHPGQVFCARQLRELLAGSEIRESHRMDDPRVQDPYSFRCIPQVHGAALDQINFARGVVEIEMGSVTDNPIVVGGRVVSGGNFHGQPLSFAFDAAAFALTALGNISERRTYQILSGQIPGLKPFLARDPGLESGFMVVQYTAAALASENKGLAHPASADSISTCANKEDFVSMGMGAALKLKRVVWNCAQIVAIELLCAAEGIEERCPLKPGRGVAQSLARVRTVASACQGDEVLSGRLERLREFVLDGGLGVRSSQFTHL
jgi:histidine ammonia-lyase